MICQAFRLFFSKLPWSCVVGAAFCSSIGDRVEAMPPHPHDQGKIEYPNPLPNPLRNHSHVGGIGVKEVAPSASGAPGPHMVDSAATQTWRTYASWDNRTYRNGDAPAGQPYGHGFIEPTAATQPRYAFGPNTPGGADLTAIKNSIAFAWTTWEFAAKAEGEGTRTTPDGTSLLTSLSFRETGAADAGAKEIDIDFGGTTPGVWNPGAQTLRFMQNIKAKVFVSTVAGAPDADWEVSSDALALNDPLKGWGALTPEITLPWNYGAAAPTAAGVPNGGDLDYKCVNAAGCGAAAFNAVFEGTEAAFLALGLKVADSLGGAIVNASDAPIKQADFRSVALHEWGHVIGLDHVDVKTATMYDFSPFTLGALTRGIDLGSAAGAAVLYSIPIPEPSVTMLTLIAGIVAGAIRRRG